MCRRCHLVTSFNVCALFFDVPFTPYNKTPFSNSLHSQCNLVVTSHLSLFVLRSPCRQEWCSILPFYIILSQYSNIVLLSVLYSTDLSHFESPRSISVDLLIETSAPPHSISDDRSFSADNIPGSDEMGNTAYLVIGGGEAHVDDLCMDPPLDCVPQRTSAEELSIICDPSSSKPGLGLSDQVELNNRENDISSPANHELALSSPSPPAVDQDEQQSVLSTQDSTISRLIDAVSLGNEYDTCASISALIGQFELSMDHATPKKESGKSTCVPSLFSVTPKSNKHSKAHSHHKTTDHLISPLKAPSRSQTQTSPRKASQNTASSGPCTIPFYSEPLLLSSPETTDHAVYTILDEEVLSPASVNNQRDECNSDDKTVQRYGHNDSAVGSFTTKQQHDDNVSVDLEGTASAVSRGQISQRGQYNTPSRSQCTWEEAGGYVTSPCASPPNPDHFLLCHDSAGSSLMEVELNVDGDPMEDALASPRRHWNGHRNNNNTASVDTIHNGHYASPLHKRPSHSPSPLLHNPTVLPWPRHRTVSSPTQFNQPNGSSAISSNHRIFSNRPVSRAPHQTTHHIRHITNGRHGTSQDRNGHNDGVSLYENISYADYLSERQRQNPTLHRDLYSPVLDYDTPPSTCTKNGFAPTNYSQHTQTQTQTQTAPFGVERSLAPPPPQVSKAPSPCKSKSLGDLTSEDISCNFQSKYKVISRSFVTPARDPRRIGFKQQPQSSDPLTEQLRKLVNLEQEERHQSKLILPKPLPISLPSLHPCPVSSAQEAAADDLEDPPPLLHRRLSSRSQSRVRHIANRAREKQEALKQSRLPSASVATAQTNSNQVVLRQKSPAGTQQNPLANRHSTGSYIAGYLEQLEDRGLPEGACASVRYSYGDHYYTNNGSAHTTDSSPPSEPEVYFLLRL